MSQAIGAPLVYIIILNYQGYADTIGCLESIARNDYPNYHVLVLDNASPNDSAKRLTEYITNAADARLEFIETGRNGGFAAGNNVGIQHALERGADFVWLLNNDTEIAENALSELVAVALGADDIGITGSSLMEFDRPNDIQALGGAYNCLTGRSSYITARHDLHRLHCIQGASMLFRAAVFRDVGLLSEDYFLYFEEPDMAERIRGRWRQAVAVNSLVYHKGSASIGDANEFGLYYMFRNSLRFTYKYYRLCLPSVALVLLLRIFKPGRPYNKWRMTYRVFRSFITGGVKDFERSEDGI